MHKIKSVKFFMIRLFLPVFLIICFSSCATHKDATELRNDLSIFRTSTDLRLSALENSISLLDSILKENHTLSMSIRANLGSQASEQRNNLSTLIARQDEITYQLQILMERLQAIQLYGGIETQEPAVDTTPGTTAETAPPQQASLPEADATFPSTERRLVVTTPSATIEIAPEELFRSAVDDINRGNYAIAESRFLTFLIQFPEHELAGDAQYWLGEAAFGQKKYDLAVKEFDKLINQYKKSSKIPSALLKKGLAQIELGQGQNARSTLNGLIKSFPESEDARIAKEQIEPQ